MLKTLFSLFFIGLLSAVCIWGAMHYIGHDAPDKGYIPPARLPRVTVYKICPPEPIRYLRVQGDVIPDVDNRIRVPVEGAVRRISARPGENLKAGAVIAELDDSLLRKEYQKLQIKMGMAQGRLQVLESKGSNDAQALKAANEEVMVLRDRLEDVQALMDSLVIKMPRPGRLGPMDVKPGETLQAGDVLTTIEAGEGPMIEAWLSLEDFARLKPERTITILVRKAQSMASLQGSWRPSTEPVELNAMMREIWVRPPIRQRNLIKAGQRMSLLVPVTGVGALQAPETAVQWVNGEAWVYVVEKTHATSRVEGRKIRVGETLENQVEILEGLAPGEVIVLEGANLLHNKQEVAVMGADVLESDTDL